jgi:hypothetical protein
LYGGRGQIGGGFDFTTQTLWIILRVKYGSNKGVGAHTQTRRSKGLFRPEIGSEKENGTRNVVDIKDPSSLLVILNTFRPPFLAVRRRYIQQRTLTLIYLTAVGPYEVTVEIWLGQFVEFKILLLPIFLLLS